MKRTKLVKIDDVEYELTQLGGFEGLDLFDRLTGELGPQLVQAAFSAMGSTNPEAAIAMVAAGALVKLPADLKMQLRVRFAGLSKLRTGELMLPLGDGVKLDANGTFDQHFAGRFGHMQKWLFECLKWSFVDFLPSSKGSSDESQPATK